ncbi:MAG: hypothetical protein KDA28_05840 [Phycisphaerales bacterium]|nr:hypothetical protein [Phycisphaerales bacterium]
MRFTLLVGSWCSVASGQSASVWCEVPPETYGGDIVVEVWATWTGIFDGAPSALAGFGLDLGIEANHAGSVITGDATLNPSLLLGSSAGVFTDTSLHDVKGGQLANLFGFANPGINLDHPIPLFTFPMTLGLSQVGDWVEISVTDVNPNGGVVVYPNNEFGATVAAPNDIPLHRRTTRIMLVPGPSVMALFSIATCRRRSR